MSKIFRKIQYNSPVVLTFTLMALVSYGLGLITNKGTTSLLFSNYRTSYLDPLQYVRLFTHVLGHANWMHFAGNFIVILIIGPMLEEKYGSKNLTKMILLTAFVTGLIHTLFSNTVLLGASGIVYMFIILSSFTNTEAGRIPLTLIIVFFIFVGREVFSGVTTQDNISQISHILGGVCGVMFAFRKSNVKKNIL
jgi:rhomboid protease GluP